MSLGALVTGAHETYSRNPFKTLYQETISRDYFKTVCHVIKTHSDTIKTLFQDGKFIFSRQLFIPSRTYFKRVFQDGKFIFSTHFVKISRRIFKRHENFVVKRLFNIFKTYFQETLKNCFQETFFYFQDVFSRDIKIVLSGDFLFFSRRNFKRHKNCVIKRHVLIFNRHNVVFKNPFQDTMSFSTNIFPGLYVS